MTDKVENLVKEEIEYQSISEFLESTPPNQTIHISDLAYPIHNPGLARRDALNTPDIQLHCAHTLCNGTRFFRSRSSTFTALHSEKTINTYITYKCSNCQVTTKTFSLTAKVNDAGEPEGTCYKFGEYPIFGPPVPSKLLKLIGPDRDIFLKGRRCENQGLGIGAFIYYRRVIEHQKNRIFREIIKVSEKIKAPQDRIDVLKAAADETQFSKALSIAKDALPESLLIDGHSPLLLLHSALSEAVHAKSDEECLSLASSVRIVLTELSDRLSQALKDEVELSRNWHWIWSKFYFNKKHYGLFKAVKEGTLRYFLSILKFLFYFLINDKVKKKIYFNRASGFYNALLGKSSWYRPRLDD